MENLSFCLRKEALNTLNKRICDFKDGYRQNIALLGSELLGKSTLLKNFLNGVTDEKLATVYVDIVPFEFNLFVKRFLNSLLYNYLKKSQLISTREDLNVLAKRAKESLPLTSSLIEPFLNKIEKEKHEVLFKELFCIVDTFSQETKKSCIIILDEFHHLKSLGLKNIFQDLGKKIMFQKNILFICSSSQKNEAKDILANDLSLLFGNFETIELQMLEPANAELLIHRCMGDIAIAKEFINFLINFTGGHPFYLKNICEETAALCKATRKEAVDNDILITTLERLLFQDWGTFNLRFSSSLAQLTSSRNKNDFLYLLDAIALGKNRLKDITAQLRRQKKEIVQKLNKLCELGLIAKNGSFYAITDRLMSFWLKFVHVEKLYSLSPEYTDQVQHFRDRIASAIDEFIHTSSKNLTDRMMDLFGQFEEDDIQIDRKRFHLSPFKELRIMTFDNSDLKIGIFGKTQDSLWLAAVKEDGINEHDVQAFLLNAKKFKHKIINKVIVGLGDIDRNAKLLAKESSIMTWDIASLNNLFDLYGKPRIIK